MAPTVFADTLRALDLWEAGRTDLAAGHKRTLAEIRARVLRLDRDYSELMEINEAIARERVIDMTYEEVTETLRMKWFGQDIALPMKRKDPNVPVQIENKGWVETYPAEGGGLPLSEEAASLRLGMGPVLEGYYYNAHRVVHLSRILLGRRDLECKPVAIVRNKLIEHSEAGDIYTYGNGSKGPVIRPIRPKDSPWRDDGLVPNTEDLVSVLAAVFAVEGSPDTGSGPPTSAEPI